MRAKSKSTDVQNGKPKLTPAVGYLRKSQKGKREDGRQKQEKSIPQQQSEITKLAEGRFEIIRWFVDEGVSGWKRGAKRPDFTRMLSDAATLGAAAILCDNIDRFSRATFDDVQEDTRELRKAGVRWIVTASHGIYDLGNRNDIGELLKFVVAVWSAHEYSRQLGRRSALAKRNAALEGRRTGGATPYGLAKDGTRGLKPGDRRKVETVRWIFDQFANRCRSMNSICADLNRRKVPGPRGGSWSTKTVKEFLRQSIYAGNLQYNRVSVAQFYRIDDRGEVVDVAETNGKRGKVFDTEGYCRPIVSRELFDKAQRLLDAKSSDRSLRKRMGYPLSGILKCGHCGKPMYGMKLSGTWNVNGVVVYRCSAQPNGDTRCSNRMVRQDQILPFILNILSDEMNDLEEFLAPPPASITNAAKTRRSEQEHLDRERTALQRKIAIAEDIILQTEDVRNRQAMDQRLSKLRDELERIETELNAPTDADHEREELKAVRDWWSEFTKTAVRLPVKGKLPVRAWFRLDPTADDNRLMVDPRVLNQALHRLGTEVTLKWTTTQHQTRGGHIRNRHRVTYGRFRLGAQHGKLPLRVSEPMPMPA